MIPASGRGRGDERRNHRRRRPLDSYRQFFALATVAGVAYFAAFGREFEAYA